MHNAKQHTIIQRIPRPISITISLPRLLKYFLDIPSVLLTPAGIISTHKYEHEVNSAYEYPNECDTGV